jgi:predicted DNA-binding transcriptional regulator YafY
LKQYNNRWFLFGFNPVTGKYDWNLAIDRIMGIKETTGSYQKNTKIKWQDYFDDIIGVTRPADGKLRTVILQFLGKTGKYMVSKPLHGSQRSKWLDNDTLEIRLKLIVNYELERLILSYADSVKVIEPETLMISVKSRLGQAYAQY